MRILSDFLVRFLVVAAVAALAGCAQVRKATYPEDFVYLSRDDVSTRMHRIAGEMAALDDLLATLSDQADSADVARQMTGRIDRMEGIVRELGLGAAGTNHLLIDAHLDQFITDLQETRLMLAATPPRFHEVGKLVGSCNACHRFRE